MVNLRKSEFAEDSGPIVTGCECYTCANHSRAYIHHLLNTHEMTAQVLLQLHNMWHYLSFFAQIREAVQEGRLPEYKQWFMQQWTGSSTTRQ